MPSNIFALLLRVDCNCLPVGRLSQYVMSRLCGDFEEGIDDFFRLLTQQSSSSERSRTIVDDSVCYIVSELMDR